MAVGKAPQAEMGLGRVMALHALGIGHAQRRQPGLQARVVEQRNAHGSVLRKGSASQRWIDSCACALAAASVAGKAACTPAVRPAVSWATSPRRPSGDTLAQPASTRAAPKQDKRCSTVMACLPCGWWAWCPWCMGLCGWAALPAAAAGQEAAGAGRALRVESRRRLPRRGCRRAHGNSATASWAWRQLGAGVSGVGGAVPNGSAGWWAPAGRQRSAPFGPGQGGANTSARQVAHRRSGGEMRGRAGAKGGDKSGARMAVSDNEQRHWRCEASPAG